MGGGPEGEEVARKAASPRPRPKSAAGLPKVKRSIKTNFKYFLQSGNLICKNTSFSLFQSMRTVCLAFKKHKTYCGIYSKFWSAWNVHEFQSKITPIGNYKGIKFRPFSRFRSLDYPYHSSSSSNLRILTDILSQEISTSYLLFEFATLNSELSSHSKSFLMRHNWI